MKRILTLAATVAALLLAACGGDPPVTVTQIPVPAAMEATEAVPVPVAMPSTPAVAVPAPVTHPTLPSVPPTIPYVPPGTYVRPVPDIVLTNIPVNNVKRKVNAGQQGVNTLAFTAAITSLDREASVQQLVFRDRNGNDLNQLFTRFRIADESGDICPIFSCYPEVRGAEVRISFTFGWRPSGGELHPYALQADVLPNTPANAMVAFTLVGVQSREWGVIVESDVYGRQIETTTITALPEVTTPKERTLINVTAGMEYEVLPITVTCQNANGCLAESMKFFVANGRDVRLVGSGTLTQTGENSYKIRLDHFLGAGVSVTWNVFATASEAAPNTTMFASWYDMVFRVGDIEVSPIANPASECIDMAQRGGGSCTSGAGVKG